MTEKSKEYHPALPDGDVTANPDTCSGGQVFSANPDTGLVSRREFFSGMLGAGAVLATGAILVSAGCSSSKKDDLESVVAQVAQDADIATLKVATDQLLESAEFAEAPLTDYLVLKNTWDLPKGSLVYVSSDTLAMLLVPGATTEALIKIGFIDLTTGELTIVMDQAQRHQDGYVIYDARASNRALVWVECNMQTSEWQVYCASLTGITLGESLLIDEGGIDYEPPMLCANEDKVYWTYMPDPMGPANQEDSYLKTANVTEPQPQVIYTSHGRMITNPVATEGILTFVPRVDTTNVYYQLTALETSDDSVVAVNILPQALRVTDAIYMSGSFTFCTESNYDYAGGLAYFGTYRDLGDGSYLHVNKMPTSAAVQWKQHLILKSTRNIVGLDTANKKFFVFDALAESADYGDILAAWGIQDNVVIYTTVGSKSGLSTGTTRLRVFGEQVDNVQTSDPRQ